MKAAKPISLSLALMLTLLCACGNTTSEDTAPSVPDETTSAEPVIPDADLEGFELHIAKPIQEKIAWSNVSFAVSEENGEVLNDALYHRNLKICEKYNFKLSDTEVENPVSLLNSQVMSGDNDYDLFMIQLQQAGPAANSDTLTDFHSIPNIDLSNSWWDQDMLRDLSMGDKQYMMSGDVILSVYDCMRVVMYNKHYAEDLGLSGFYELVNEGKWTIDAMYKLMQQATVDINNDGTMDYRDRFGLLYNDESFNGYLISQNQKLIESDGTLSVFNDKFVKSYENVLKVLRTNLCWNYNKDKYPELNARQAIVTMFDNKQALFFENGISAAAQYMRNLENVDFGFLPLPKADEQQEKYYTHVSGSAPVMCIPVTNYDRLESTGFVLEALGQESNKSVIPAYFETCFSLKYTHDEESYQMILLAAKSRMYDRGLIYNYGSIKTVYLNAASNNDSAIISKFEAIRDSVISDYNKSNGK